MTNSESAPPTAPAPTIGIPYAANLLRRRNGAYGVRCPVCRKAFYGSTSGDEDEMTKSPKRVYAKHYAEAHS